MSEGQQFIEPDEAKGWLFFHVHRLYQALPNWLRKSIDIVIVKISPDIPIDLATIFKNSNYRKSFLWAGVSAFLFCFVGTLLLSYFSGTFSGHDPARLYFVNDWTDIIEYTLICPAYVAFDILLIGIVLGGSADWMRFVSSMSPTKKNTESSGLKTTISICLALAVSCVFTISFIKETLDPSVYVKQFWFVDRIAQSGERILGIIGLYYSFLNFILTFISVLALLMYFKVFVTAIQIGTALSQVEGDSKLKIEELKNRLYTFTMAYIVGKILAGLYMLNTFTWKWTHLQSSFNLILMGTLLSIFGVFIVSVPRYYIELQWYQLKIRQAKSQGDANIIMYDDIRPLPIKLIAHFLDILIIGGFLISFWAN